MNEEELAFILKHSTPKEILIINYESKLIRLRCPFKVIVRNSIGELLQGDCCEVESVLVDDKIITVFKISKKHYYYYHFIIC
jgi:hypothetical protein